MQALPVVGHRGEGRHDRPHGRTDQALGRHDREIARQAVPAQDGLLDIVAQEHAVILPAERGQDLRGREPAGEGGEVAQPLQREPGTVGSQHVGQDRRHERRHNGIDHERPIAAARVEHRQGEQGRDDLPREIRDERYAEVQIAEEVHHRRAVEAARDRPQRQDEDERDEPRIVVDMRDRPAASIIRTAITPPRSRPSVNAVSRCDFSIFCRRISACTKGTSRTISTIATSETAIAVRPKSAGVSIRRGGAALRGRSRATTFGPRHSSRRHATS